MSIQKNENDWLVIVLVLMAGIALGNASRGFYMGYAKSAKMQETCQNACFFRETEVKLQAEDLCVCDDNVVLTYSPEAVWQEK